MNMRIKSVTPLGLCCAFSIVFSLIAEDAKAINLTPGQVRTVGPGVPADSWALQGATLNVLPGGQTLSVAAAVGSVLNFSGATSTGTVSIASSTGTFLDSTMTASTGIGLSVVRNGAAGAGSTAQVSNSVISGFGRGVNVSGGSTVTLTNTQVTGAGVGATFADNGYGLVIVGGAALVEGASAVTGSNGGVLMIDSGAADATPSFVLDNSTITGTAGSGIVVRTLRSASSATVRLQNGAVVNSGNGVVVEVGESSGASAFQAALDLTVDDSVLVGDVQVFNGNVADVHLLNGSSVAGNMTNINSLEINASSMSGNLNVPAGSTVAATMAANSTFTGNMSNIGSLTMDSSAMTGNVIEASGSVASISLANRSSLTGSLNNIGSLVLDNSDVTGDITQDASTPATLNVLNTSRITGTITNVQSTTIDASSSFNMVNDSSVGSLTLNGGTVNLRAGNAGFRTLSASSLAGSGIFALGTDLAGHLSDQVNITGNASGSHTLVVQNTGVDPIQENHAQQLVHTGSGEASFAVPGGKVDVGTFVYRLEQRGTDWYLVQQKKDDGGNPPDPVITPSTRAVVGVFSAAPSVWYGELSTLRSRMGELRNGHEQGGLWARTYGNKYQISAMDQVDYVQTQSGLSFGVDTPVSNLDGQWLLGVMGGYSRSDLDLRQGTDGQVSSYYLGVYSTWISDSGYYVDALIKANRFHNEANVRMSDGVKAKGNYDNYGVGGSIEGGKNIKFANDWFVEPYVQVSTLWVGGERYGLDNGMNASSNHADSLLGKVGAYLGRTIALDRGGFVQPYVKVAGAHEFARSNEVKVNRNTFSNDLSGSRGELGAGIVAQLTNVLQVHADFDYSNGKNIEQPWGVGVGLRYAW